MKGYEALIACKITIPRNFDGAISFGVVGHAPNFKELARFRIAGTKHAMLLCATNQ
jgi:hypothetical protein